MNPTPGLVLAIWISLAAPARLQAQSECTFDAQLSEAAAELLATGRAPDAAGVRNALGVVGSDAVGAHALFLPVGQGAAPDGGQARVSEWLTKLKARAAAPLICGEAQGDAGAMWLATARAGGLSLVGATAGPVVKGWLLPAFADATLVFVDAEGALSRRRVSPSELQAGVPVASAIRRPARVQLVATGPYGPQPVAERPIAEGEANAPAPVGAEGGVAPGGGVSGRVNALRRRRRVGEVRRHALLRQLAARHAARVCREGRVAHSLSPDGDPESRLRGVGIEAQRIGEAVARADTPAAAFAALQRSPSHLMTLVEPSFTDGGVGVAQASDGRACVVVLLARWPRYVGL